VPWAANSRVFHCAGVHPWHCHERHNIYSCGECKSFFQVKPTATVCAPACCRCTTALRRATSPLFGREYVAAAARVRAASAPPGPEVQHAGSAALQAAAAHPAKQLAVPAVLQFEGWWQRIGPGGARQKCSVHISYHTDTDPAAFFVRYGRPATHMAYLTVKPVAPGGRITAEIMIIANSSSSSQQQWHCKPIMCKSVE